jgi:hypothetical protein
LARIVGAQHPVEGNVRQPALVLGQEVEAADRLLAALVVSIEDVDGDRLCPSDQVSDGRVQLVAGVAQGRLPVAGVPLAT